MPNTLYFGDNLHVLREHIPAESVDLIYLDPPFNSNRGYNVLFQDEGGYESEAQITAFGDTWHWDRTAEAAYLDVAQNAPQTIGLLISVLRQSLGSSQMMAYLVMMTIRLVELHRVLKPTGSLYLHCDPTASHYLKIVLDAIFGSTNFCNHITWQRSDTHNDARKQLPTVSDHILFYRKSVNQTFHPQYVPHAKKTLEDWYSWLEFSDGTVRKMTRQEKETQSIPADARRFNTGDMASPNPRPNLMYEYKGYPFPKKGWRYSKETMEALDKDGLLLFPKDPRGRIMRKRYLDEQAGAMLGDVWTDISQIRAVDAERLGYPTQKPLALLERIIKMSSNPGDVVFDPFCGCGTAVVSAEALGRQWIGIDITYIAISLIRSRIKDMFPDAAYKVIGMPEDVHSARKLAEMSEHDGRYQFQFWALSLVQAKPIGGDAGSKTGKKGSDRGIDGIIPFIDDASSRRKQILVQVKSGHVKSGDVRDLRGVLDREKAEMGVFITLEPPTAEMKKEASTAGIYHSVQWNRDYPRLQILTIEDLLHGAQVEMPPVPGIAFKHAPRAADQTDNQPGLDLFS